MIFIKVSNTCQKYMIVLCNKVLTEKTGLCCFMVTLSRVFESCDLAQISKVLSDPAL